MALHLVTGYAGKSHITSADQGAFNSAIFGRENYVLNVGNCFSASAVTSNTVKVLDGEVIMQGRHIRLEPGDYEEVTIENGTQEYKRNDLICIRYSKDSETGVENTSFVVIKGTPDASAAVDPAYTEGNILDGILTVDLPLYRVPLDGLNIGELVPLFETKGNIAERIGELNDGIKDLENGTTPVGDSKKLNGMPVSTDGKHGVACINTDYGVLEIGKYIDFHSEDGQDFILRLAVEDGVLKIMNQNGLLVGVATLADFANYVPFTDGNIDIKKTNGTDNYVAVQTEKGNVVYLMAGASGNSGLYSNRTKDFVVKVDNSGNATFNGTATENLPLTGGTLNGTLAISELLDVYSETSDEGVYSSFIQHNNGTHARHVTDANNFDEVFIKKGRLTYAKMVDGTWSETDILHSGNVGNYALPKSGGTVSGQIKMTNTGDTAHGYTYIYKNNSATLDNGTYIQDIAVDGTKAYLQIIAKNKEVQFNISNGTGGILLHTGNSAKVVVSETPLTAEGSVRVW